MNLQELSDIIRLIAAGRRDAADKLAEIIFPLLQKPAEPKVTKRKVAAE